ncbi:YfcC family protein [Spiroplasma turonicum]|uniref:Arginine/ornithine antiporter n=1 Tax=Spiroplasma turonicum TaxID=216946 RepID=A0A0K1P563_9MOLU|nr:YfcC family protein [Spiroplasma turonicum]AKU79304.1 arginine/ornithine antiporter [Spiroplasma turonicum]ALX70327.1 arginine/ornithine antiporter [Spiroplasma turonicum]
MSEIKTKKKFKFKLPTAFTILLAIILLIILISWIPGTTGDYTDAEGVVHEGGPAGIFDLFLAPMKGLQSKVDIAIFVLTLGGFLGIVIESQALDAGIGRLVKKMKGHEIWIIPIIMFLFSIGGTVYGMCEETIALYPVIIPVLLAAGFDVMTAVLTILFGAGIGVISSTLNPFVIQIAVDNAHVDGLGTSTGIVWRLLSWIVLTSGGIGFVMFYAIKVKKDPSKSPIYKDKDMHEKMFAISQDLPEYTKKRKAIMALFSITFIIMIISLIAWGQFGVSAFDSMTIWVKDKAPYISRFFSSIGNWYFLEISALFFFASIIIACLDWKGEENYVNSFIRGSADILSVCLVVAFAAGIGFIMEETGMQQVLVKSLSNPLSNLGKTGFIFIAFIFFLLISIVMPSTSGFATAVFPILGPVANGITPGLASGTITGFSMANGIVNLISPTSAILMAALSLSKISYDKFLKASWPLICGLLVGCALLLIIGSLLPLSNTSPWF